MRYCTNCNDKHANSGQCNYCNCSVILPDTEAYSSATDGRTNQHIFTEIWQKLPDYLIYGWKSNTLSCTLCPPAHTAPFIFYSVDGFFNDANIKHFMEEHRHHEQYKRASSGLSPEQIAEGRKKLDAIREERLKPNPYERYQNIPLGEILKRLRDAEDLIGYYSGTSDGAKAIRYLRKYSILD